MQLQHLGTTLSQIWHFSTCKTRNKLRYVECDFQNIVMVFLLIASKRSFHAKASLALYMACERLYLQTDFSLQMSSIIRMSTWAVLMVELAHGALMTTAHQVEDMNLRIEVSPKTHVILADAEKTASSQTSIPGCHHEDPSTSKLQQFVLVHVHATQWCSSYWCPCCNGVITSSCHCPSLNSCSI